MKLKNIFVYLVSSNWFWRIIFNILSGVKGYYLTVSLITVVFTVSLPVTPAGHGHAGTIIASKLGLFAASKGQYLVLVSS